MSGFSFICSSVKYHSTKQQTPHQPVNTAKQMSHSQ